jgi:hypothetical protein
MLLPISYTLIDIRRKDEWSVSVKESLKRMKKWTRVKMKTRIIMRKMMRMNRKSRTMKKQRETNFCQLVLNSSECKIIGYGLFFSSSFWRIQPFAKNKAKATTKIN